MLRTSTTTDVIAVIQAVYVSLTRCQHAQIFFCFYITNPYGYQYRESVQLIDIRVSSECKVTASLNLLLPNPE